MKTFQRYGLVKAPFTKDIPPDELFESVHSKRAVKRLRAAIEGRTSAVLTGESGTGKTFVLRALENQMSTSRVRFTYIHNSQVSLRDFYRQLSMALGLEPRATPAALFRSVTRHIEETSTEHKVHPVVLLDEAQHLPTKVFEALPILLNYQRDSKPFLSLVLVGLVELRELLTRTVFNSLSSRLPVRIDLTSLEPSEVRAYLEHRMKAAGCEREVFAEDAVLLMKEATGGILRKLDVLATASLEIATERKSTIVDASAVEKAVEELCAEALV